MPPGTARTRCCRVSLPFSVSIPSTCCRYTQAAIQDLKDDEDEMLRGVDWAAVARYVDLQGDVPGGFR